MPEPGSWTEEVLHDTVPVLGIQLAQVLTCRLPEESIVAHEPRRKYTGRSNAASRWQRGGHFQVHAELGRLQKCVRLSPAQVEGALRDVGHDSAAPP